MFLTWLLSSHPLILEYTIDKYLLREYILCVFDMGDVQELDQLNIKVNEQNQGMVMNQQEAIPKKMKKGRWIRISLYASFILIGQSVALLLGRLYFIKGGNIKGGNSKWIGALVQVIGFPLLFPLYYILPIKTTLDQQMSSNHANNQPSCLKVGSIYVGLGLLLAGNCIFFAMGLQYLPVSTFTLLCASQLAFNAVFSFFINGQNFTPYIINSLVLLTTSSILLVFQKNNGSSSNSNSNGKYALGFLMTLAAALLYGLMLSLTQLVFKKVLIGGRGLKYILDINVYEGLVSSCVIAIGLFASGEWKGVKVEMERYELGKVSYVMTLVWTVLLWEMFMVGLIGLTFEVSALFSIVISTLALPITPVLAVIFLHDEMDGIKGVAMTLAVWGFVSYAYQHYLDEFKSRGNKGTNVVLQNELVQS